MSGTLADNLLSYDATALAEAIVLRTFSVVEVVEAHFQRIEKLNSKYNALVTLDKVRAVQRAKEADEDLARGKLWGPLHGVPITIKDALETEGLRTTAGYKGFSDCVPADDAWVVSKLKNAGAIVIGKTNCAELCADIQTTNPVFGITNNPWDTERTSGGSSGGEAAAVALGLSPLGIGSDTAGSIRIPASYCGVFGLKSSVGKIPRHGLRPLHSDSHARQDSLTVVGLIARSVRDLSLCYEVLTNDLTTPEVVSKSPTIYWTHEFDGSPAIDDEVSKIMGEQFAFFAKSGVNVVKVESPLAFGKMLITYLRLSMFEFMPEELVKLGHRLFYLFESFRSLFRGGAAGGYLRLKQDQSEMSKKVQSFMESCDCWVLPATPSVAFVHQKPGSPIPLTENGRVKKHGYWNASMSLTYPFNIFGNPCVVIPVGKCKDGMPVAIQVVGKLGQDMQLLKIASYIAERVGSVDFSCGRSLHSLHS